MRKIVTLFSLLLGCFGLLSWCSAEEVRSFDAAITIQPDASIVVTERIEYDFGSEKRHGIFRVIPYIYETASGTYTTPLVIQRVTDTEGNVLQYDEDDYGYAARRIKIGNPNTYVSGQKTYVLTYQVSGVINYFADHDELYWNVNGNDWEIPFAKATAVITLPQGVNSSDVKATCYRGSYGSNESCDQAGTFTAADNQVTGVAFAEANLEAGEGLTVVIGFPKGVVVEVPHEIVPYPIEEPSLTERVQNVTNQPWVFFIPLFVFFYSMIRWWRSGRDPKGRGIIVAEFEAPDNLSPGQVGTLVDGKATNRDISSEIIQLAIKGYLTITRIPKTGLLEKDDYTLEKQKEPTGLPDWQKELMEAFFKGKKTSIKISDLRDKVYTDMMGVAGTLYESLSEKKYFTENPQSVRITYLIRGAIIGLVLGLPGILFGWLWIIAGMSSGFIYVFIGFAMPKLTAAGVEAKEKILGLKLYLSVAEKERLAFHNAPANDPKLFEKLLPYAMVLGVEKAWAEQFASLYTTPPSWYHDSSLTKFNAVVFASSLHSFSSTTTSMISSSPSRSGAASGGSGFSGGSSGGGFGGGGGGSW